MPEPLPAPLIVEALGVGVTEEAAAHSCLSIRGKAAVRSCGDWRMSPKNTWCVLGRGKQTAP